MMTCDRPAPKGWVCTTAPHTDGAAGNFTWKAENVPCGLVPKWWNLSKSARRYRMIGKLNG